MGELVYKKYRKLTVYTLPKIKTVEKLIYSKILQEHVNNTVK